MNGLDSDQYAGMALHLFDEPDVAHTLERMAEYAKEAVGGDDASILLLHGRGQVESAMWTGAVVAKADRLQIELGDGPSVRSLQAGEPCLIEDTASDPRWPVWSRDVARLGLRSALCVQLGTTQTTLGTLTVYAGRPDVFDADDVDAAGIFARHASVALDTAREENGLREAIDSRHLIGQAQGILMERYGIDSDRAFAVLRRFSRDSNTKLRVVAALVIRTRRLPGH